MLKKFVVTGALALSLGLGAGLSPAAAWTNLGTDEADNPALNGERILGVDISEVTPTAAGVQSFLASLAPGAQQSILTVCANTDTTLSAAEKVDAHYAVLPFCDLALGNSAMTPDAMAPNAMYPVGGAAG